MMDVETVAMAAGMYAVVIFIAAWIMAKIMGENKPAMGSLIFTVIATLLATITYVAVGPGVPVSPAITAIITLAIYAIVAKASYNTTWKNAAIIAVGVTIIFIVINAAIASIIAAQITSSANQVQAKSLNVAEKALEKATIRFAAKEVLGLSAENGKIDTIILYVKLAPGSDTIDLEDTVLIFSANAGETHAEYAYGGTMEIPAGELSPNIPADKFVIVINRSTGNGDKYLEQGETYALAFKLPQGNELGEGQDWKIVLRTPYTQDLIVTGYAPEIIMGGQTITLKT